MSNKNYSVIVPRAVNSKPSTREMSAAYILNDFFKSDVKFVVRSNNKTPDFLIKNSRQATLDCVDSELSFLSHARY